MLIDRHPSSSTDPVVRLHATLVEIDLATQQPARRLSKKQILALDSRWYATLQTLLTTPATTDEGRRCKAGLFLQSLKQFDSFETSLMSEAEMIAMSLIADVVGAAEIERLTAMPI
jgi:hypothetical protein